MSTPNLIIIIRIPDENGWPHFVELDYIDGNLAQDGNIFHIDDPLDTYNTMEFYHIVLAEKIEKGSIDIARYKIKNTDSGKSSAVHALNHDDLQDIVRYLVSMHVH